MMMGLCKILHYQSVWIYVQRRAFHRIIQAFCVKIWYISTSLLPNVRPSLSDS